MFKYILFLIFLSYVHSTLVDEGFCEVNNVKACMNPHRYLLYDINPPEGFNLRRDVYVRMAVFAHSLQQSSNKKLANFMLVLPPWTNIYHWSKIEQRKHIPWSHFFDMGSLRQFAPVMEMFEFFKEIARNSDVTFIDEVYVLKHFDDMFETGNFEERMAVTDCKSNDKVNFFHYTNLTSDNVKCLSFHGHTSQLKDLLLKSKARTILMDHAEVPLHDHYGSSLYWQARRSMRFNKKLEEIATSFRETYLNSTDITDGTKLPENWQEEKLGRSAVGGPYLGVHLRRRDFIWGRPTQIPSIAGAVKQIKKLLKKLALETVFIATDASTEEYNQLKKAVSKSGYKVVKFNDPNLGDGQIAIIDQIITARARYFTGTHESTFSFRIQEEREILGFPTESTFNRLCGDDEKPCEAPSKWTILH